VASACLAASLAVLAIFVIASGGDLQLTLHGILARRLKHPPRLSYLSWSTGMALLLIALCVALQGIRRQLPDRRSPLAILGRQPLFVFNLHFAAIFGVGGLLLGWLRHLSPLEGVIFMLAVLLLCVVGAAAWENRDSLLRHQATLAQGWPESS
jgi:fucose 4-O-acetylase-like acetyltransferase